MPRLQPIYRHPDLFASQGSPVPITAPERIKLLELVSALLMEALADAVMEASDEDHA